MRLLTYLLVNSIAIMVASYILPGVKVDAITTVLMVAIVLGVINTFIKPIILLLTLPLTLVTLGLFTFIINALLVLLTSKIVHGFSVQNFLWALLFSLVVSVVSAFLSHLAK
jgi:putative membrane protein